MNKILTVAVALSTIAFVAKADTVNGYIQDHYKSVVQQTPHNQQVCNDVYVPNNNSVGPDNLLSGAIIGGILGNNVVKGDNAGAAGAIIGGLIGSDMKGKKNQVITGYRQVNKCNTQYNERTEEYLAGYRVSYEALGLNGTVSRTRSTSVGEMISVNVNITAY